jgi:excisionase family DNA binding protein
MTEAERLLSSQELAQLTGFDVGWVYGQVEAGKIPHYKVGKYLRFKPSEIAAWLEAQRGPGRATATARGVAARGAAAR